MNQTQTFINSEGDAWFERNRRRLGERDPVSDAIDALGLIPKDVIEIGCANGWRLHKLQEKHHCKITGIDPSRQAIWAANDPRIKQGWADDLHFEDGTFDMVIYGFCLYVTEPADWFRIVAEGDRVLKDFGNIVVHDFAPGSRPYARKYEHTDDVLAYHVNFAGLWAMHPWYRLAKWHTIDDEAVAIIQKRCDAIPVLP